MGKALKKVKILRRILNSILNYYKKLLALRKSDEYKEVFVYGKYDSVFEDMKDIYIYTRTTKTKKVCVLTNMREDVKDVTLIQMYLAGLVEAL